MTLRQFYSVPAGLLLGIVLALAFPAGAPYVAWLGQIFISVLKLLILPLILVSIYRLTGREHGVAAHRRAHLSVLPRHLRRGGHHRHPAGPRVLAGTARRAAEPGAGPAHRDRLQPGSADRQLHPQQPVRLARGRQRPAYRLCRRDRGARRPPYRRDASRDPDRRCPGPGRPADADAQRRTRHRPGGHRRPGLRQPRDHGLGGGLPTAQLRVGRGPGGGAARPDRDAGPVLGAHPALPLAP